mgnify:CR=1 FL=1
MEALKRAKLGAMFSAILLVATCFVGFMAATEPKKEETKKAEPSLPETVRLQMVLNYRNAQVDTVTAQNLKLQLDMANQRASVSSAKYYSEWDKALKAAGYPEGTKGEVLGATEQVSITPPPAKEEPKK